MPSLNNSDSDDFSAIGTDRVGPEDSRLDTPENPQYYRPTTLPIFHMTREERDAAAGIDPFDPDVMEARGMSMENFIPPWNTPGRPRSTLDYDPDEIPSLEPNVNLMTPEARVRLGYPAEGVPVPQRESDTFGDYEVLPGDWGYTPPEEMLENPEYDRAMAGLPPKSLLERNIDEILAESMGMYPDLPDEPDEPEADANDAAVESGGAARAALGTTAGGARISALPSSIPNPAPHERFASLDDPQVSEFLAQAEDEFINRNTLVFEYGPLLELERRLHDIIDTSDVDERVGHLYLSHVRQAIHDAVQTADSRLQMSPRSGEGLMARLSATQEVGRNLHQELSAVASRLKQMRVEGAGALFERLDTTLKGEVNVLDARTKNLHHPSLGASILGALRERMTPKPGALVGDARKHRNNELKSALGDLYQVSGELRDNAGNLEWEREHGKRATDAVGAIVRRMRMLTTGVEGQVDALALRKGLKDSAQMLDEASEKSAEGGPLKSALEASKRLIIEFTKALIETLSRMFNASKDSKAGGPRRPAPAP